MPGTAAEPPQHDAVHVVVDRVTRVYGGGDERAVVAVQEVTHTFRRGRFHAVLGPSGSGKSTLLHLIGALDRPTSGTVTIAGRDVGRLDDAELAALRRRGVGLVFQFFNLVPSLTVEENALLPILLDRRPARADRERLDRLLVRLGIAERRHHLPEQLSGGERQRAAIARAMLPEPPLVLADEPTGSLDRANGAAITAVLRELSRDGACVVAVTHDVAVADQADEIIELRDGRIAAVRSRDR